MNLHAGALYKFPIKGYFGHTSQEIVEGAMLALKGSLLEAHNFLTNSY